MPRLLKQRATHLVEYMDDPTCDLNTLYRTYAHFGLINYWLSAWQRIYQRILRPRLSRSTVTTLLDIGFGGGDVVRRLSFWAKRDGLVLDITAIDPDQRALDFVQRFPVKRQLSFRCQHTQDLLAANERFDIVISNHVLHHLAAEDVQAFCSSSASLAKKLVVHNDVRRSDPAFLLYPLTSLVLYRSFAVADGRLSIQRSFTPQELEQLVPGCWQIKPYFPFRNLLILEK